MLALVFIFVATAVAMAWFGFRELKSYGSAKDQVERRHPSTHLEEQDEMVQRRKDDQVGGEN